MGSKLNSGACEAYKEAVKEYSADRALYAKGCDPLGKEDMAVLSAQSETLATIRKVDGDVKEYQKSEDCQADSECKKGMSAKEWGNAGSNCTNEMPYFNLILKTQYKAGEWCLKEGPGSDACKAYVRAKELNDKWTKQFDTGCISGKSAKDDQERKFSADFRAEQPKMVVSSDTRN
ncbi:hypothetical protein [uncultured Thiodictyon sp.]|uniref:hypothetical protein n=1 Tax=uncultured Thiodictyon sp. TaxID=1846217 RepID=UPI0025E7F878|nr:hypothetical protein [uncultured Thiodictyon sp.]